MTAEQIQHQFLSLDAFLRTVVLPTALGTLFALFLSIAAGLRGEALDLVASALGFAAVIMTAWQAIDRVSARRVHDRLLAERPRHYRARLATLPAPIGPSQALRLIDAIDRDLHA